MSKRIINICTHNNPVHCQQRIHNKSVIIEVVILSITDHSHSIRHQQLVSSHHSVVCHINQHITYGNCNHGQNDGQWNVSDKNRSLILDTFYKKYEVIIRYECYGTSGVTRFFSITYLFGLITSSVTKFK